MYNILLREISIVSAWQLPETLGMLWVENLSMNRIATGQTSVEHNLYFCGDQNMDVVLQLLIADDATLISLRCQVCTFVGKQKF